MAKTKARSWDAVEHLETAEDMAAYLEAALEAMKGNRGRRI